MFRSSELERIQILVAVSRCVFPNNAPQEMDVALWLKLCVLWRRNSAFVCWAFSDDITPTPTPPGREGQKQLGAAYPGRRSKTRFALGYYRIVLSGLQFALARGFARKGQSMTF
jgi:hypothetical protein